MNAKNEKKRGHPRSSKLAGKLKLLRERLKLSQNEMLKLLRYEDRYDRTTIAHYELGDREPPPVVLLAYARAGGVTMESLVDDELELPITKRK